MKRALLASVALAAALGVALGAYVLHVRHAGRDVTGSPTVEASSASRPAIACKTIAASSTVRVIGPTWSRDQLSGRTPRLLTRP